MRDHDDDARHAFACPSREGESDGINMALLDPARPDNRRFLIQAEHPELQDAVEAGHETIVAASDRW